MKQLAVFLNESLKNTKCKANKHKPVKKGYKTKNLAFKKYLDNAKKKDLQKILRESLSEDQENFIDNYYDWIDSNVESWSEYWEDEDSVDNDLDTLDDWVDNNIDDFTSEYGFENVEITSEMEDKMQEIRDKIADEARSYYEDKW